MYNIHQVNSKQEWETYLETLPEANFLQSWNWGQFHISLDKDVHYLQITNTTGKVVGCALVIVEQAKRGNYVTIAGGPLIPWSDPHIRTIIETLLIQLRRIADQHHSVFVRIRPQAIQSPELERFMTTVGFITAPMHLTADLTLQLDLTQSEDHLLKQMRKNTRYSIRKAERVGVTTHISTDPSDIHAFYQQQIKVAKRQDFVPFSEEFLQKQFDIFVQNDQAMLVHAYQADQLLSSAFILMYGKEAVYHYGVSTELNFTYPGSYACQWRAITEAKKRGLKRYNFWGVNPADQPNHRFAGVGLFKRGFGGQEVAYLPAHDYPFSPRYYVIYLFEFLRKKIRGL